MGAKRISRGAARDPTIVLAPTERGSIDNLRVTELEPAPPAAGPGAGQAGGGRRQLPGRAERARALPGRSRSGRRRSRGRRSRGGARTSPNSKPGNGSSALWPGAMASRVNVPVQLLAPVPDGISATAAASTPTAVLTALLAFDWAKLRPGDRVLVHAASGGVGLAAVQLAQQRGAIVFATASTYKRAMLARVGRGARLRLAQYRFRRSDPR